MFANTYLNTMRKRLLDQMQLLTWVKCCQNRLANKVLTIHRYPTEHLGQGQADKHHQNFMPAAN
jgi:hypothetical protein